MAENEELSQTVKKGGDSNKKKAFKVVTFVVVLAVAGILIYRLWPKDDPRNVVVNNSNVDDVLVDMGDTKLVEPGYYTVTMNNEWHFADGIAASEDAYVENVESNTNDVYFDIFLNSDKDNAVYKSPVIPRGSYLEEITLDKDLDPGTYDCVCIYHLIDDEQNTVDTLNVAVTLIVEG